jgi:hypothetical protein
MPGLDGSLRRSVSRYDLVLAVIPVALIGSILAARVLGAGVETGLVAGAALGGLALADAVLVNPPRDPETGERAP